MGKFLYDFFESIQYGHLEEETQKFGLGHCIAQAMEGPMGLAGIVHQFVQCI